MPHAAAGSGVPDLRHQGIKKGAVSLRSNRPKKYEARLLRRVGLRRIIEV